MKAKSNEPCLIHDRTSEAASIASGQKHPGEGNVFPRGRVGGLVCLLLMAVLSVTAVTGPFSKAGPPAGLSVPLGLLGCYLIRDRINFRASLAAARDRMRQAFYGGVLFWGLLLLPLAFDLVSIALSGWVMPEYLAHVKARATMLSFRQLGLLMPQILVLALLEELAWRAFAQRSLQRFLPAGWAVVLSSFFFAIAHAAVAPLPLVAYDLFFVFLNSLAYGAMYAKYRSAGVSAIAHAVSNLAGAAAILMLVATS